MLLSAGLAVPRETVRPSKAVLREELPKAQVFSPKPCVPLRHHAAWMLVGNIVSATSQWSILIILARFGSPALVGQYALALAVTAPVFMFAGLNLSNIQATDLNDRFDFGEYFALHVTCLVAAVVATGIYVLCGGLSSSAASILFVVAIIRGVEMLFDCAQAAYRKHEAFDLVAKSKVVKGAASVLVLFLGLWLSNSLPLALLAVAISLIGLFVVQDVRYLLRVLDRKSHAKRTRSETSRMRGFYVLVPLWRWVTLRRMAWLALPLGIAAVLNILAASVPRYLIAYQLGEAALGIFAPIASSVVAIDLFVKSFAMSAMPQFARTYQSEPQAFAVAVVRTVGGAAKIGVVAFVAAWLFGDVVLFHLLGSCYAEHASLLPGMVVAGTLSAMASVLSLAATSTRMYRTQLIVYAINLLLVAILATVFVAEYGLWGAALAIGVGAAFRIAIYAFLLFANQRHAYIMQPVRKCL